jgi:hypothetical protein
MPDKTGNNLDQPDPSAAEHQFMATGLNSDPLTRSQRALDKGMRKSTGRSVDFAMPFSRQRSQSPVAYASRSKRGRVADRH